MTIKKECGDCGGGGGYGYESAPGCYTWEKLCPSCKGEGTVEEDTEPCDGCKVPTGFDYLHGYGPLAEVKWLCPSCMLRALKTRAELPAFPRERERDMKRTVEVPAFTMHALVFGGEA